MIHSIAINITGAGTLYVSNFGLPDNAIKCDGIAVSSAGITVDGDNYEYELVLNNDRNHIAGKIQTNFSSAGCQAGIEECNIPIEPGATHQIILRGINTAILTFNLQTSLDIE